MITLRRAGERHHELDGDHEAWSTFDPRHRPDSLVGFGILEVLDETRLQPGADIPHRHGEADVITYVREGVLAHDDIISGHTVILRAGDFQRMTVGSGGDAGETSASAIRAAHVFQILLRPSEVGLAPGHEEKRFSAAERRARLRVVASPDARMGSLRTSPDASVFSVLLEPGQHVVHELGEGRCAWFHLVHGSLTLGDIALTGGDGVGVAAELALSVTASEQSEFLLIDVPSPQSGAAAWPPRSIERTRDTGPLSFAL